MPTNVAIDDRLLDKARKLGGHRTKRETVNEALAEYVRRRERVEVLELIGKVEYDVGFDYKKSRRRR
jgi:Arc/MetJ family transcription regulator